MDGKGRWLDNVYYASGAASSRKKSTGARKTVAEASKGIADPALLQRRAPYQGLDVFYKRKPLFAA